MFKYGCSRAILFLAKHALYSEMIALNLDDVGDNLSLGKTEFAELVKVAKQVVGVSTSHKF